MKATQTFEWDEGKNIVNIQKHGIDFSSAISIFSNPHLIFPSNQSEEERLLVFGKIKDIFSIVVITYRGNSIRLISARKANRSEVKKWKNKL